MPPSTSRDGKSNSLVNFEHGRFHFHLATWQIFFDSENYYGGEDIIDVRANKAG